MSKSAQVAEPRRFPLGYYTPMPLAATGTQAVWVWAWGVGHTRSSRYTVGPT